MYKTQLLWPWVQDIDSDFPEAMANWATIYCNAFCQVGPKDTADILCIGWSLHTIPTMAEQATCFNVWQILHKSVSSHYNEISERNELIKENRLICFTVSNYFKKDLDMKQQRNFLIREVKKQKKASVSHFPSRAYLNDLRTSTKNSINNAPQNLTRMTP